MEELWSWASLLVPPALGAAGLAIGVTAAIERWGGTVGGLLGTLPTTIIAASLGIAARSEGDAFVASMAVIPAGMLLNAVFLWLWRALPPRLPEGSMRARLAMMVGASLSVWLVGALALALGARWARAANVPMEALGVAGLVALIGLGVWACWERPPTPKGSRKVSWGMHMVRGSMAAMAIGTAVWLSAVGGEIAAGVASVFPAIFMTSMVALWVAQGEAVQVGAVGPMMLGSSSVAMYAVAASWTFPALGPVLGALVAWVVAALTTTVPSWAWLSRRRAD